MSKWDSFDKVDVFNSLHSAETTSDKSGGIRTVTHTHTQTVRQICESNSVRTDRYKAAGYSVVNVVVVAETAVQVPDRHRYLPAEVQPQC